MAFFVRQWASYPCFKAISRVYLSSEFSGLEALVGLFVGFVVGFRMIAAMSKSYRGGLPRPDKNGDVRPEVGRKRFTVGNVRSVSNGEMIRRLNSVRDFFDRQCEFHKIDYWSAFLLPYAKKIAAGERLTFHVSQRAKRESGQASEEAQSLHLLHELGLDIVPDDPSVIASGEMEIRSLIDTSVRDAVAKAVGDVNDRLKNSLPSALVDQLQTTAPSDPSSMEVRTLHQAIDAYRTHREKTGKRKDNGKPTTSVQHDLDHAKRLKKTMNDVALWELADKNKLDELFAHWRNRPTSERTGKRISDVYAKHILDSLWSVFVWVDEATDWKWEMPKGARRIKRTGESLDSDRKKMSSRRVSASTYTPEQLATIAHKLDRFGKMVLGLSVNCAMQPAEIGRLEVDSCFRKHPDTEQEGDWVIFDRPKTFEYGEWSLWPEVAKLMWWGVERANALGCERLVVSDSGLPWYREDWTHPHANFAKWWQSVPSGKTTHVGVITKVQRDDKEFPRHTIKYLRKILPNLVRPKYGKEIADLINARKVDRSGRLDGRDTDRYADRLYDEAAAAIMSLQDHFRPFLDALK